MHLTPSSEFVLRYTDENDYIQVLKETIEPADNLFSESAIEFLYKFFRALMRVHCYIKNYDMLKDEFMNTYIHPNLKKALRKFSNIVIVIYRETKLFKHLHICI
jgi:hypothetical protein